MSDLDDRQVPTARGVVLPCLMCLCSHALVASFVWSVLHRLYSVASQKYILFPGLSRQSLPTLLGAMVGRGWLLRQSHVIWRLDRRQILPMDEVDPVLWPVDCCLRDTLHTQVEVAAKGGRSRRLQFMSEVLQRSVAALATSGCCGGSTEGDYDARTRTDARSIPLLLHSGRLHTRQLG